jgi:hypothetical protein
MRAPIARGPRERVQQQPKLPIASNKRCLQAFDAAGLGRHVGAWPKSAKRQQWIGLAFGGYGFAGFVRDDIAREPLGQVSNDHLAGFSPLLQSGCDIDRVAADHELAVVTRRGKSLACVDSDTHGQVGGSVSDLDGGTYGALGVVIVDSRHAENDHRGISGEFLDGAAICLRDLDDALEVTGHDRAHDLRVGLSCHGGRAHDIREQDRDDLPLLAHAPILGINRSLPACGEGECEDGCPAFGPPSVFKGDGGSAVTD